MRSTSSSNGNVRASIRPARELVERFAFGVGRTARRGRESFQEILEQRQLGRPAEGGGRHDDRAEAKTFSCSRRHREADDGDGEAAAAVMSWSKRAVSAYSSRPRTARRTTPSVSWSSRRRMPWKVSTHGSRRKCSWSNAWTLIAKERSFATRATRLPPMNRPFRRTSCGPARSSRRCCPKLTLPLQPLVKGRHLSTKGNGMTSEPGERARRAVPRKRPGYVAGRG